VITNIGTLYRCALVFLLGVSLPVKLLAQGQVDNSTRDSAVVKDLPLTTDLRQVYVGNYATELPGGEKVTLRILVENGALKLWASNPGEARRLLYQGDNVFQVENTPGFVITFVVVHNFAMMFKVRKPEGDLVAMRVD
jgi:hypothetical protein